MKQISILMSFQNSLTIRILLFFLSLNLFCPKIYCQQTKFKTEKQDNDFPKFKNQADDCFTQGDYDCAIERYENALVIKVNDKYCKERLKESLVKSKQKKLSIITERKNDDVEKKRLKDENERLKNQIQSQTIAYYGSLFGLQDRYGDKYNYTGIILNNKPNGKGVSQFEDGDKYDGYFINGFETGKGTYSWTNGNIYEGDWVEGNRNGKGKFTWANGNVYEGDWIEGKITGKGKFTWANGDTYEGEYINGFETGKGRFTSKVGVYEGDWVKGKKNGQGKFTWADGDIYEGDWIEDQKTGKGKFISDSLTFEGNFTDGVKADGSWKIITESGILEYNVVNGIKQDGKIKITVENDFTFEGGVDLNSKKPKGFAIWTIGSKNGHIDNCRGCVRYEGEFENGLMEGKGKCFDKNGNLIYDGLYKNNYPVDKYPSKNKR